MSSLKSLIAQSGSYHGQNMYRPIFFINAAYLDLNEIQYKQVTFLLGLIAVFKTVEATQTRLDLRTRHLHNYIYKKIEMEIYETSQLS